MNVSYEELIKIEKNKFSSLQSDFHKLINTLSKYNKKINNNKLIFKFMELNEQIDKLNSDLICLRDDILIEEMENKYLKKNEKKKIKEIENDNKAIKTFIPLILMYRTLLNP